MIAHVTARVLATPALELATTVITVEEQLRGRWDRVRQARSNAEVVRAYRSLLATCFYVPPMTVIDVDEQAQPFFEHLVPREGVLAR